MQNIQIILLADLMGRKGPTRGYLNSFSFMQNHILVLSAPEGWRPHLREIMDPPLQW